VAIGGLLNPNSALRSASQSTRARLLKSEYGGERLRPDDGEASCMSRTPVGLVNHPATNLIGNYQLQMAA
jgi:hypothetical protein